MYNKGDLIEYIQNAEGFTNLGVEVGELGIIVKNRRDVESDNKGNNPNHSVMVVFFKDPLRRHFMYPEEIKKISNV